MTPNQGGGIEGKSTSARPPGTNNELHQVQ